MNWLARAHYGLRAAWRSRMIAANPFATALMMLAPEAMARRFGASCRYRWRGVHLTAGRQNWGTVDTVLLRGEYDFVAGLLEGRPRPTVVDLGANIGAFSAFAFGLRPGAVVHSVEPSEALFALLELNRRLNPGLEWSAYRSAVWSTAGPVRFAPAACSTQGSVRPDGTETVTAMTLSELLDDKVRGSVDLLKIDIEGAEEEVLCGSEGALARVDQLVVQIHPARVNEARVTGVLTRAFPTLWRQRVRSPRPLLVATRRPVGEDLPGLERYTP